MNIKRWLDERFGIHWHGSERRAFLYTRCWKFGLEWTFGLRVRTLRVGVSAEFVTESYITLMLAIPWVLSVFFTIDPPLSLSPQWSVDHGPRSLKFAIHDGYINVHLWDDPTCSGRGCLDRGFMINVPDLILGRQKITKLPVDSGVFILNLPEGRYICDYQLQDYRYKRPRWPWARTVRRIDVEPRTPIPIPGKGTTEYNIGDDAICKTSFAAEDAEGAMFKMLAEVALTRLRYGGSNWKPATGNVAS